jgi:hypothetical protein
MAVVGVADAIVNSLLESYISATSVMFYACIRRRNCSIRFNRGQQKYAPTDLHFSHRTGLAAVRQYT